MSTASSQEVGIKYSVALLRLRFSFSASVGV